MHLRGSPFDFLQWSQKTNDTSWSYQNLLKYFKKYENYEGIWRDGTKTKSKLFKIGLDKRNKMKFKISTCLGKVHGFEGEVNIEIPDFTGLGSKFVDGAQELGYKQTDLNGWYSEGFDYVTSPIQRGYRDATYNAFLKDIRNRRTLVIRKYAHVNKVC